jgi:hypothetical protein
MRRRPVDKVEKRADPIPSEASAGIIRRRLERNGHMGNPGLGEYHRHALVGMLRQSVFGRLAGYEDVNAIRR